MDWRLAQQWTLNTHLTWISDREWMHRGQAAKSQGYTLAGASLRYADPRGWDFSVTFDNLFDVDAAEPTVFSAIPYGIPLPGRSVVARFGWRFP